MNSIVIVAGGKGTRMGSELPKQFMLLKGQPILMHTIRNFYDFDAEFEIVLVLPQDQVSYWNDLIEEYQFKISHKVVVGGDTRFHSVKNGLNATSGVLIGIHDGVRPLVSHQTIKNCFDLAAEKGNAIPCIDVVDSLRFVEGSQNHLVDRSKFFRIQTPQVFQRSVIMKGFEQDYSDEFTDDASVIEKAGFSVFLAEGNEENIKITKPLDITLSELFLEKA